MTWPGKPDQQLTPEDALVTPADAPEAAWPEGPGGGRVIVRAGPAARAGMVELTIADTGIGIPAQDIPRRTASLDPGLEARGCNVEHTTEQPGSDDRLARRDRGVR